MTENTIPRALSQNEIIFLIPATINVEELINSATSYNKKIDTNKLLSFISLVVTKTVKYNFDKSKYTSHKKGNIHSGELKKLLGNDYTTYYGFLYDEKILSTRSPYSIDKKGETFGYGFTSFHLFKRLNLVVFNPTKSVKFDNYFNNSYTKKCEETFYNLFDKTKFSIDFKLAENILFSKYFDNIPHNSDKKYSAYHGSLKQLKKFLNGEYSFTRKKKYYERKPSGRFYSPLTNLNKNIRNLLYYEGEKLQQLDVKNMFPYLLSQHLIKIANINQKRIERLQNCLDFKTKYELNISYTTKDYLYTNWIEKYFVEKYGMLFPQKPTGSFITGGYLSKQGYSEYFSLDKPKSLFQYSYSHSHQFNKKFHPSVQQDSQVTNHSQRFHKTTKGNWIPKSNLYPNSYSKSKDLNDNSNLATPYTESFKSFTSTEEVNSKEKLYSNYISTKTFKSLMDKEVTNFKTLTVKGIIYDHFIDPFKNNTGLSKWTLKYEEEFNEDYNGLYKQDRALTKKLFISMLYARNNHYIEEQKVFKSLYPILYDLIREEKKGDHTIITNELFDLEADIIVDTVARGLIKQKIKTFTIHDCIAVQEKNIDISKLKLEEAFISRFGNCPKIELE